MLDNVALSGNDIFSLERNETSVNASDATKSKLLKGVTGGAAFFSFFPVRERFFAPGTGSSHT
jgi:hypothetical protein